MPRKLENGNYAFKRGCIGKQGKDGTFKLVAMQKKKIKKGKKEKKSKIENEVSDKIEKKVENKKRRSQKKTFKPITQEGGHNSNLDITVHMLREFYSKNI
jgi:hypothetical protein